MDRAGQPGFAPGTRQGLATRATTALRRLGVKATNGGNAAPAATSTILHLPAAATLARAVKAAKRVAPASEPPQADVGHPRPASWDPHPC